LLFSKYAAFLIDGPARCRPSPLGWAERTRSQQPMHCASRNGGLAAWEARGKGGRSYRSRTVAKLRFVQPGTTAWFARWKQIGEVISISTAVGRTDTAAAICSDLSRKAPFCCVAKTRVTETALQLGLWPILWLPPAAIHYYRLLGRESGTALSPLPSIAYRNREQPVAIRLIL
jgi:hypothetical protein